jgi:hypothetical protein
MIVNNQTGRDRPANDIKDKNFIKDLFAVLIFGIKVTAKVRDKDECDGRSFDNVLLKHKK